MSHFLQMQSWIQKKQKEIRREVSCSLCFKSSKIENVLNNDYKNLNKNNEVMK